MIFECVGLPGVIQAVVEGAPVGARIVVVGVCMEPDQFEPSVVVDKQLDFHFVLAYTRNEFANTLHRIAEGEIVAQPIITGHVGLEGVAEAFEELGNPEKHAKILIHP
ncbi:MAG: hypothetical protein MJE77_47000 [Proteobacteria bacterium]|nr:hypothetical protein [Pseudomonadota bacterium]